jgi:hypothetical protein
VTDGGSQLQGPGAVRLAKVTRTVLQQGGQVLPCLGRPDRGPAHRPLGARLQTGQAPLGPGSEAIVDRLACAPPVAGQCGGRLARGARQETLATPYRQGIQCPTTVFQGRALILGEWSYTRLWVHDQYDTAKIAFSPII